MSEPHKRLHTLLTDRAIAGLDVGEREEFNHLRAGAAIDPSYEVAGAAIELALGNHTLAMPEAVAARIIEQAGRYWGFAEVRPHEPTVNRGRVREPTSETDILLGDDGLLPGDGDSTPVQRTWEPSPRGGVPDDMLESFVLESSLTDGRIDRGMSAADSQRGEIPADLEPRTKIGAVRSKRRTGEHLAVEPLSGTRGKSEPRPQAAAEPRKRDRSEPRVQSAAEPRKRDRSEPRVQAAAEPRKRDRSEPRVQAAAEPRERDRSEPRVQAAAEPLERDRSEPRVQAKLEAREAVQRADDWATRSDADHEGSLATSAVVRMPVSESQLARVATYVSAIAALLMLALAAWLYSHRADPPDPETLEQQVQAAADKLEWTFVTRADPAVGEGTGGSVLWSSELQAGVLVLDGLVVNDPQQSQYQLWIEDAQREGPPVDGGVFDITEAEQARVTIDAKLVIGQPRAFKVTVERPGGVVVSAMDRLVLVAAGAAPD